MKGGSSALGNDAEPIVVEGAEAVGSSLDEFHFAVEALGDAIGAGEAPHADDLLGPVREGLGEGRSGLEAAVAQRFNQAEQLLDMPAAGALGLELQAQQRPEAFLQLVDALQQRMPGEELVQAAALVGLEVVRSGA